MIQRARAKVDDVDPDDPWLDKYCAALLAQRPKNTVRDHREALRVSSSVTAWCRQEREPHLMHVLPHQVIASLNKVGVKPVLMGTYGINGYRDQARATHDVDVLVNKKDVRKAVNVLKEVFPELVVKENAAVARFIDEATNKEVIDVMKPASRAMHAVFRHAIPIGRTHRIPDLEMALVSKFLALTSENRRIDKRYVDLGDFTNIVLHNRQDIDMKKLLRLAGAAQPRGAGKIAELVATIDAGRRLSLD
jgi:hypothetical protein